MVAGWLMVETREGRVAEQMEAWMGIWVKASG